MTRSGIACLLALLLSGFGCSQSQQEYRGFSESQDNPGELAAPRADDGDSPGERPTATAEHPAPQSEDEAAATAPAATAQADAPAAEIEPVAAPGGVHRPADRPPSAPLPIRVASLTVEGENAPADPAGRRGAEANLTSLAGRPGVAAEPLEPKLLIPEKDFQHVAPDRALRVSYDDLDLMKVLNMEPVPVNCMDWFPDWLKDLNGARIRIRGFMLPPLRESGLPSFSLARDNQICCFGRDPKVYDLIPVQLKPGTTTDYIPNRPFDVVGRFSIRPDAYRGTLQNLYEIDDAEIIAR